MCAAVSVMNFLQSGLVICVLFSDLSFYSVG